MVRCKFKVVEVGQIEGTSCNAETGKWEQSPVCKVVLGVVSGGTPENKKFFAATPYGRIEFGVVRKEVADQLKLGAEYYVDFTEAVPEAKPAA